MQSQFIKYDKYALIKVHSYPGNIMSTKNSLSGSDEPCSPSQVEDTKCGNKKVCLTVESKDLLEKLNFLKKEMQKNLNPEPFNSSQSSKEKIVLPHLSQDFPAQSSLDSQEPKKKIDIIRQNIEGFNTLYMSPFNIELEAVYVDHTATNRPYKTVEDMIKFTKKFAANPHTEFSHFGKYSTEMMHYAQNSLLHSFNVQPEDFVALPTGSGSTGAIEKAMKIMQSLQKDNEKPAIFITPYEHHSNILPWVEFYDNINVLSSDPQGNLLINQIQYQLKGCPASNLFVSISAASNVTSTLTDLKAVNEVIRRVRKEKQLVFGVDCAAFCCHHDLNLKIYDQIDFAYLSPHKNLGGAQSCGVLVARKSILKDAKPTFPGGGTVSFVKGYTKTDVMYDPDIFNRQIAGTPPFLGFYRAALCFQLLKNHIGYDFIHHRQKENTKRFIELITQGNKRLKEKSNTQVIIYGDSDFNKRANVITFNILIDGESIMQHNLVSLILADIFGIQLRSGCFCAGPFGMLLLNLDEVTVGQIKEEVSVGILKDKPGYLRLDLTFYLQLYEIDFIANAILGVAEHHKNMELVYTICNDGDIRRHKLFKNFINDKYSLDNAEFARQQLKFDELTDVQRLKKRRDTLDKQYKRGMDIVLRPIQFLKSQISKETKT